MVSEIPMTGLVAMTSPSLTSLWLWGNIQLLKNALPCTPLCKSYGGDCINQMREEIVESDKEDL